MIVDESYKLGEVGWLTEVLKIGTKAADIYAQREGLEAQKDALSAQKALLQQQKELEILKAQTAKAGAPSGPIYAAPGETAGGDKTMMYVAIGAGVVALAAVAFLVLKK